MVGEFTRILSVMKHVHCTDTARTTTGCESSLDVCDHEWRGRLGMNGVKLKVAIGVGVGLLVGLIVVLVGIRNAATTTNLTIVLDPVPAGEVLITYPQPVAFGVTREARITVPRGEDSVMVWLYAGTSRFEVSSNGTIRKFRFIGFAETSDEASIDLHAGEWTVRHGSLQLD